MKKLLRYLKSWKAPKPIQEVRVKAAHEVALKQVVARRLAQQEKVAAGEDSGNPNELVTERAASGVQPLRPNAVGAVKEEAALTERGTGKRAAQPTDKGTGAKVARRKRRRQNQE